MEDVETLIKAYQKAQKQAQRAPRQARKGRVESGRGWPGKLIEERAQQLLRLLEQHRESQSPHKE